MNFKKNFKRFFTLSRSAEGFTLVELIVVIAILGILVGVGMPAYSGYIDKANEGVDEHNLAMMNNALVVACVYVGVEPADAGLSTNDMAWNGNTFMGLGSGIATASEGETATTTKDDVVALFNSNLGQPIEFKKYTSADIKLENGAFVGPNGAGGNGGSGAGATGIFGDIFGGFAEDEDFQANVSAVKGSQFGTIGAAGLLNKVDTVTDIAADIANVGNVNEDGSITYPHEGILLKYAGQMFADMGLTDEAAIGAYLQEKVDAKKAAGATESNEELMRQVQNEMLANYAVLSAAKNTSNKTTAQLQEMLTTDYSSTDLKNLVKGDENQMAQAALIYGMYTSYVDRMPEGDAKKQAQANLTDTDGFSNVFTDTNFKAYLAETKVEGSNAAKDLAGYQAAMGIITDSAYSGENGAANSEAIGQLVNNGFSDKELQNALQGLLG